MKGSSPEPNDIIATAIARSKERRKSYKWQAQALLTIIITFGVVLVAASFHCMTGLVVAVLLGLAATLVCLLMAGYYLVRSLVI